MVLFSTHQLVRTFFFIILSACVGFAAHAQNTKYVNVFIGTDGTGHTFPGPSMPFGMVQPGPDNRDYGWAHTSGYQYADTILRGFSQSHLSGTGINELGDVLMLPYNSSKEKLKNSYHKHTESASPGYYTLVKKDDVKVELTCTERVAFHQYTFPDKNARLFIDFKHGLRFVFDEKNQTEYVVTSDVKVTDAKTITGFVSTNNWVKRTYYFVLTFDQPFVDIENTGELASGKAPAFTFSFSLKDEKILKVKVALSTVSADGAMLNLKTELPHWNFEQTRSNNQQAWEKYLSRITIDATEKQKEIFYTSFYHLLLQPSNIADVDVQYRGVNNKIAVAPNKEYYSTLSIWDVYRGAFPLLQIVAPEKIDGIINSMLLHHKAAGFLPIWTVWGQDNYCMIGNHAIPMILSAYKNGFTKFDAQDALRAMVETSTQSHINSNWELYNQYGYYPFDKLDNEAVSRTLESGYDDWCVAEMAKMLGDTATATTFYKRANYYKNLYDSSTQFFRGKDTSGNWRTPFDPLKATSPLNNPGDYTEANAWQYLWTPAQHDVDGMIQLLGGKDAFTKKLDEFFITPALQPDKYLGQEAMIGQYAHGNEPSHHIIYLYAFSNSPKNGHRYINKVVNEFHNNTPDGMIGNDDCGQMSAWYMLSVLGFYPVNPANGEFVLGSPQVKKAQLKLSENKTLTIEASRFTKNNIYTDEVKLNGKKLTQGVITFEQISNGGTLNFRLTNR
jgi:predicted alpha-1,2-mannosidase